MEQMNSATMKMDLPLWLKMFSNTENSSQLDQDLIARIAQALHKNKSVVVLRNGKPVRIQVTEDNKIQIQPIDPKYVLK